MEPVTTYVYVDAFNLYYGAVRGTKYKWLNILKLCKAILDPKHDIKKIKYFTDSESARPGDPGQPTRQRMYFRALLTVPGLEIIKGTFYTKRDHRPTAASVDAGGPLDYVEVVLSEEKGSDVNLGVHMVHDGHLGCYDAAVLISNDSDLAGAVSIVRHDLKKVVGVINPHPPERQSRILDRASTFTRQIEAQHLRLNQFTDELTDEKGRRFRKPAAW
ncbi:MAG: NYN domain-containing protein [Chloroflexi bacterium]|nr:NYN domain-containing protein [Chloroflexota bacterium]